MRSNTNIIRATYEGSSANNGRNLMDSLAPDASWTEAAGFPYAGTYIGPDAVAPTGCRSSRRSTTCFSMRLRTAPQH